MKTKIRLTLPLCLAACGLVTAGGAETKTKGRFVGTIDSFPDAGREGPRELGPDKK